MKYIYIFLFALALSFTATAQTDTLPAYLQVPYIPPFKILLADSSWYSKVNLPAKKPVLILYFSPDCGHCQLETEELISRMKELKNLHVVMVTSRPYADMAFFANHYKLRRFPSIKIGADPQRLVTNFYNVKFTPFSALYDKKGKLVKVYEDGINWKELVSLIQ